MGDTQSTFDTGGRQQYRQTEVGEWKARRRTETDTFVRNQAIFIRTSREGLFY